MSTWFTESFRGQHYQDLASIRGVTFPDWATFVGLTSVTFSGGILDSFTCTGTNPRAVKAYFPVGEAHVLRLEESLMGDAFRDIFWKWGQDHLSRRKDDSPVDTIRYLMTSQAGKRWHAGLDAVYALASNPGEWINTDQTEAIKFVMGFTRETMVGMAEAARFTPVVGERQFRQLDYQRIIEFCQFRMDAQFVKDLYKLRYATRKYRINEDNSIRLKNLARSHKIYYVGALTIITGPRHVYVLTVPDIDRIQQILISTAMLHLYLATCSTVPNALYSKLRACVLAELYQMWDVCSKATYMEKQVLCKSYKKGMDLYQSYLAGPLSDDRRIDLIKEVAGMPEVFEIQDYVSRLRRMHLEIAQEAGKIYRLLCAPDYDIGESVLKRAGLLAKPNPTEPNKHRTSELSLNELRQYHAGLILMGVARSNDNRGVGRYSGIKPAWWDEWMEKGTRPSGLKWVDEFDWTGCVAYHDRDALDPDVWKDSACAEEDWKEVMADREDKRTAKRNMLTRLLRDDDCPVPETARDEILRPLHVLRAGFKMEAHKDIARIFYIGNLTDRLFGSEIEHNISRIARYVTGFTVGAHIEDVVKRIGRCYAPELRGAQEVFHISSDYESWSPGMHGDVQRMSHENWAKLFGRPNLVNQRLINEDTYLLVNKRGYKGACYNTEANYEGLNGKEMTVLHCALVGYTILRARRLQLNIPTADFAAFIDDGALTLVLPRIDGEAIFKRFWDVYQNTTAYFGFKLDKAKCYLSNRFLIYLNEVYYGGRHIAHGLRAVMRIGTRDAVRGETIYHVMEAVGAGCRGASKCGLSSVQIWKACVITEAIEMYIRFGNSIVGARAMVLFCYAPRVMGGLQSPIGLTLDCNYSGTGGKEALSHIKLYTKYNDEVHKWFGKMCSPQLMAASGVGFLQNHRTVSNASISLKQDYLSNEIRLGLGDYITSDLGQRILSFSTVDDAKDIGEAILRNSVVTSTLVLDKVVDSLVSGLFSGFARKFESSSTLIKILGSHKLRQIDQDIRMDEKLYLQAFRKVVSAV